MSIYLTGDCHMNFRRMRKKNFPERAHLTKNDYLIVLGDFGVGPWGHPNKNNQKEWNYWLNWLEDLPFTVMFVDGNHENHAALDAMDVSSFLGGKVHFLREHVIHLMRGQYYTIEEQTFWTFGGGRTHDGYQGGILNRNDKYFHEKRRRCDKQDLFYRIENESWWAREIPSPGSPEYAEGRENLASHGWKVDHILTHCAPSVLNRVLKERQVRIAMEKHGVANADSIPLPPEELDNVERTDPLTDYLQEIYERAEFKHWYLGHYHHEDTYANGKVQVLYRSIVPLCLFRQ